MKQLKTAIFNALAGNARLVALLGSADAISAAWPGQDTLYSQSNLGDPYDQLASVAPPRARLTYRLIAPLRDRDVRRRDDLFQLDAWGPNVDLVEEIVAECTAKLDQNSDKFIQLPITALPTQSAPSIIKETYCARGVEMYEADTRIYHTVMSLRVLWNP